MSVEGNASSTYELRGKLSSVFSNIIDNTLSIEGAGADAKATGDAIRAHSEDTNNPHGVTAAQVGAFSKDELIPLANGGTNRDLSGIEPYSIIRAASNSAYLLSTPTADGAFFATGDNKAAKFATLPIPQGGTGATTAADARTNLGVGTNKVYNKLTDIGITTFPTNMKTVADAMPNNSTLMLDSRDILSDGTSEISDLGSTNSGVYMFMKGNSSARMSLLCIYGTTSATTSAIRFGCYASTTNAVIWLKAYDDSDTIPISHGGTGATSAADACNSLGIKDYVIAQGVSGSWTYQKWNSGIAVCYGTFSHTPTQSDMNSTTITLPFEFINTNYHVGVSGVANTSQTYAHDFLAVTSNASDGRKQDRFSIIYYYSSSNYYSVKMSIYIIGKWK